MSIIYLCSSNLYVRKYLCVCVHSTPQIKELFLSWLFQKLTFLFTVSQFNNSLKHIILISLLPWWTFSWNFVAHTTVFKHYNRASITPKLSTNPCRPASYVTCVLNTVNVTGSKPPGSSSFLPSRTSNELETSFQNYHYSWYVPTQSFIIPAQPHPWPPGFHWNTS